MPKKVEYTFVVEKPLGPARAEVLARLLTETALKRQGCTAKITSRERRPGDRPGLVQSINGIPTQSDSQAVG